MSADRCKSDGEVARDVTNVLNAHAALRDLPITTEVHEGCVTISGTVRTWKDARDACRLARTVDGVVRSRSDLVVDPVPAERRTDQELALAASDAIRDNLLIRADIRVTAKDGVVTLEGTVPYPSQRYDAEAALERVRGLRGVVNLVCVAAPDHVDLGAARQLALQALQRHATADGLGLVFEERDGTLHVSGVLDSAEEKSCVLAVLRTLAGVHHLVDEIRISAPHSAVR